LYKALSAGSTGVQAFVATCTNPPANMTAWWRAEDDANDFVGGHNGSAQNGATFASGKVGQAFSLDGTNDYISVPDSAAWDFGTGDFTIDMWVKFTSVQTQNFFIGHDDGGGEFDKWIFWLVSGQLQFHINSDPFPDGGITIGSAAFAPSNGTWYHVALTRIGSTYTFYVNGSSAGTATNSTAIPNASAALTIGQAENSGFINGLIDEVEIFSRALSSSELLAIVNADAAGKCTTPTPGTSTPTPTRTNTPAASNTPTATPTATATRTATVETQQSIIVPPGNVTGAGAAVAAVAGAVAERNRSGAQAPASQVAPIQPPRTGDAGLR
jgi:hypothetical protein